MQKIITLKEFLNQRLSLPNISANHSILLAKFACLPIPQLFSISSFPWHDLKHLDQQDFQAIIAAEPEVLNYALQGLYAFVHQEFEVASNWFGKGISAFPEIAFFYAARCLINRYVDDDEGAFYDYQVAKRLDFHYHSVLEWQENLPFIEEFKSGNATIQEYENSSKTLTKEELNTLGLEYVHVFDYLTALTLYTKSLQFFGEDADLYFFRGVLYTKLTSFELALSDFRKAIALNEKFVSVYVFIAKILESYQLFDEALTNYDHAIQMDPKFSMAYEERANLFERQHEFEKAVSDYNQLILLNTEDFYPYTLRADLKEKLEDWEGALADYTSAIQLNPYYSDLYQYRATIKEKLGDTEGAALDHEKFLALEDE